MTYYDGLSAHERGEPISACPFSPGDRSEDASAWRSGWIDAETRDRSLAGTLGASDDDYRAAGLRPPARDRFGAPLPPALPPGLDEWPDEDAQWAIRFTPLLVPAPRAPRATFLDLVDRLTALFDVPAAMLDVAEAVEATRDALDALTVQIAARPRTSKPCPVHGPTQAGLCRRCARGT